MRGSALLAGLSAAFVGLASSWATAEEVVKIGVLADIAGTSADIGGIGSVEAVKLAVKDFGGKVNGKRIVVVSADHQQKPDIGSAIASRWYDRENVNVIIDVPVSSVALAVQKVAERRKKLFLITLGTSAIFTSKTCSPYSIHWADDTNALAKGTARAVLNNGGDTWFFISADFIFGRILEAAARGVIATGKGIVKGGVKAPLNTPDFSSFLLQAQASKAKIVGLGVVGSDFINVVKQASEFGIVAGGQNLVGFLVFSSDIHSLGLKAANGLQIVTSFYWDQSKESRVFAKKFMKVRKVMPTKGHAMNYAATIHYLQAVKATGSTDALKVAHWMKKNPADYFGQKATVRNDGRVMFDLALYQVKSPKASKGPWDYYKKLVVLKGKDAFAPMDAKRCNFAPK